MRESLIEKEGGESNISPPSFYEGVIKMKRALILAIMLMAPLFGVINIYLPDTSAPGGSIFDYPVFAYNVSESDSITTGHFELTINVDIADSINVNPGDLIANGSVVYDLRADTIIISLYPSSFPNGNGVLFYVRFYTRNPETIVTSRIAIRYCYFLNPNADSIPLTVNDTGQITIIPVGVSENSYKNQGLKFIENIGHKVRFTYNLPYAVTLKVYDINGRLERRVKFRGPTAGNIDRLPAGVHFIVLEKSKKAILVRRFIVY